MHGAYHGHRQHCNITIALGGLRDARDGWLTPACISHATTLNLCAATPGRMLRSTTHAGGWLCDHTPPFTCPCCRAPPPTCPCYVHGSASLSKPKQATSANHGLKLHAGMERDPGAMQRHNRVDAADHPASRADLTAQQQRGEPPKSTHNQFRDACAAAASQRAERETLSQVWHCTGCHARACSNTAGWMLQVMQHAVLMPQHKQAWGKPPNLTLIKSGKRVLLQRHNRVDAASHAACHGDTTAQTTTGEAPKCSTKQIRTMRAAAAPQPAESLFQLQCCAGSHARASSNAICNR